MCGIVGLYLKDEALQPRLGALMAKMLAEMTERGPDSAGFAVYRDGPPVPTLSCLGPVGFDWDAAAASLASATGTTVDVERIADHALLRVAGDLRAARAHLIDAFPAIDVLATGEAIEIFKGVGDPMEVARVFGLEGRSGTHGIAHTRMATESAVTIAGSHPFSTGPDTCLVHNGSLSNHFLLRGFLEARGEKLQTENDSEVAAAFLSWRMREGDTLKEALEAALKRLDGFYTLTIGTRDGFAVLRDPIACKPAVLAETDQWVAMASEFRAIAQLPGVEHARIWEPEPGVVYSWGGEGMRAAA
ncbi:glutamine amidotransferase family protein [Roseibacterium sp. SDUM158016]|jgi:amidophosphoribosyltransferase|uniref:class II glutamine amidotransferase n=1 Tax=Roseicyclus sediminis TaxID=2980997 RepID=UPI0021CDF75F|nr:glutamine amidotransferase family protein [Roseibacterium sp. SDUM158016]MCU4652765.1 glutamine amidotransferase family protein [Roseibacterium sp. SDUM158016]